MQIMPSGSYRFRRCCALAVLFFCFAAMIAIPASAATTVSGIISTNTTWTAAGSPYSLSGNVQIAYGTTLTIGSGVTVIGNNRSIEVFGVLRVDGTNASRALFDHAVITPGDNESNEPYVIDINYGQFEGGSLHSPTGASTYGHLLLRDSILNGVDYFYLWYPIANCYIERNLFIRAGGISIGQNNSINVYIRNNVFYEQSSSFAVENWASYSGSTVVEYNSFLSTDRIALKLPPGYNPANIASVNNYWNTTDRNVIQSMIFDKNDNLSSAGYIAYEPFLTSPHPNTPAFSTGEITPTISGLNPSTVISGAAGFTLTVNGTHFSNTSTVKWNGSLRPSTFVNNSQLKVSIPATDIATPGTAAITVVNPGGGTSNSVMLPINQQLTFAQLALGGGYKTTILLRNLSNSASEVVLKPRQQNEQPWGDAISINGLDYSGQQEIAISIAALGTKKLVLSGQEEVKAGYLKIISSSPGIAAAYFYELYSDGVITCSTGTPASQSAKRFVFPAELSTYTSTGLAIVPTSTPPAPVLATLYDAAGSVIQQQTIALEGHRALFFDQIFTGLGNTFIGSVVLSSDQDIYVAVLRTEVTPTAYLLTSVPPEAVVQ